MYFFGSPSFSLFFTSYRQPSFLCSSISETLSPLSFSFLSERLMLLFIHTKAALVDIDMNNVCVTVGFNLPKLTLSMHVFGLRTSAYAFWHTVDIQTDTFYICKYL